MIKVKRGEEQFWKTFEHYKVPEEWQQELYNYIILGFPPGSFHTAMFANDLARAAVNSHRANTWQAIVVFMKWLLHVAPNSCWGSREEVAAWLDLTDAERREICEARSFVLSEKELAWELLSEK